MKNGFQRHKSVKFQQINNTFCVLLVLVLVIGYRAVVLLIKTHFCFLIKKITISTNSTFTVLNVSEYKVRLFKSNSSLGNTYVNLEPIKSTKYSLIQSPFLDMKTKSMIWQIILKCL